MKPVFIFLLRYFFLPVTSLFVDKIEGKENIPEGNNFIVAPNHLNGRDHFFVGCVLKEKIKNLRFVGAMDSFKTFFQSSLLYYLANTIIIHRKKEGRKEIIVKIMKEIRKNKIIVVYPEGDSNPRSELLKGKTGIAEIVKEKIPVLPIGFKIEKKGRIIKIGKLMKFSQEIEELEKLKENQEGYYLILRKITDKIMRRLSVLSQKPYLYEKNQ